jgi:hypothetical protein
MITDIKPKFRISGETPKSGVENLKPSMGISSRTTAPLNDWTYDQEFISYNQEELTYDGITFVDIIIPRSIIKNIIPKLRIV